MPQPYRNGELVIVIDCSDLARSARFWAGVLGYVAGPASSPTYRSLIPEDGHGIEVLLQRTPDDKHQKNRLHLDLRTASLEKEAERIPGLGASLLTDHPVIEHGWRWHVLADPDGKRVLYPAAACRQPRNELIPRPVGGMCGHCPRRSDAYSCRLTCQHGAGAEGMWRLWTRA